MATTQCDQCAKDIKKSMFCSTNCRVKHFRGIADKKTGRKRPPPILQRSRIAQRIEQDEYGNYRNGPGFINPAYHPDTGYDEAAAAVEI